jgi:hypothetical protein
MHQCHGTPASSGWLESVQQHIIMFLTENIIIVFL